MAWIAPRGSAHHQMKLCKDEQSDQLVLGLISPVLPSASHDMVSVSRKRPQQAVVYQKGDFAVEEDDVCDELTNATEKKRRLTIEQVKYLEMSFTMDLKLEPERKALIAMNLGLRPRQVAIWFQNRRARWKNKLLEQDYETLKAKYEAIVRENENMAKRNEAIMEENKVLLAQVAQLSDMIRDRDVPGLLLNGMAGGPPPTSVPDSDSDSESGSKEEQLSTKSELASPTKWDDQSEMQDSGHSYPTPEDAVVALVDQPTGEISSFIVKYEEAEDGPLLPSDMVHNHPPLLFHQYVNSAFLMEDLFNWEDTSYAFPWGV